MDGETETGVTIMYMVEKLDAGDIISQVSVPINETDDTGTLFNVLSDAGVDLLKNTLPSILNETNERIVRDESLVTFARNISREAERIDWTRGGKEIYDKIRGIIIGQSPLLFQGAPCKDLVGRKNRNLVRCRTRNDYRY